MDDTFSVRIDAWDDGASIPERYAFARMAEPGPIEFSQNLNPEIRWEKAPAGTRSFAILCIDADAPTSPTDVNVEGRTVPADLPRAPFSHWVLIDIPATASAIPEGAVSNGVTAHGKPVGRTEFGTTGQNDYTGWFTGDADMEGVYGGYDGSCPPWNDSLVHHYTFEVFALEVESLGIQGIDLTAEVAQEAIKGHVLASASHTGTYSLNRNLPRP